MWPWGHLAVGYLVYAGLVWYRERRAPGDVATLALALGTQAPDLVDKPLGWYLGVLPGGRSLAHSLIAMAVIVGVVASMVQYRGQRAAWVAFATGYATHLVADSLDPVLSGEYADLAYLLWPVLELPESEHVAGVVSAMQAESFSLLFFVQLGLALFAVGVWIRQEYPGMSSIQNWVFRYTTPGDH